jgi:hypothetical protein
MKAYNGFIYEFKIAGFDMSTEQNFPLLFRDILRTTVFLAYQKTVGGGGMEPASGIEPPTYGLLNRSDTDGDNNLKAPQDKETDGLEEDSD